MRRTGGVGLPGFVGGATLGAASLRIKKVAACARFTRSGERGTEAAPATSERYRAARGREAGRTIIS